MTPEQTSGVWRIWKDNFPKEMERTNEVYPDVKDATARCLELNQRNVGGAHWCRIWEPLTGYVAFVQWAHEDELPPDINRPHFDAMFDLSRVDITRLYPYIVWDGKRIYLAATENPKPNRQPKGSSALLEALSRATNAYAEDAMKNCQDTSAALRIGVEALVRESFQAGFKAGVYFMENTKPSSP